MTLTLKVRTANVKGKCADRNSTITVMMFVISNVVGEIFAVKICMTFILIFRVGQTRSIENRSIERSY